MIRKPEQQLEQMEQANVRPGWSARRPESDIEAEDCDEKKNRRPRTSLRVRRI